MRRDAPFDPTVGMDFKVRHDAPYGLLGQIFNCRRERLPMQTLQALAGFLIMVGGEFAAYSVDP